MTRSSIILIVLLTLTIFVVFISGSTIMIQAILPISGIKFLLVAFQFMEMRKAHPFWKAALTLFAILLLGCIYIIYQ